MAQAQGPSRATPEAASSSSPHGSNSGRLFETIPIEPDLVATILGQHWVGYKLGDRVKASQNHTYTATDALGQMVIVRVTPDPSNSQRQRIADELALITYLHNQGLQSVCQPIPPTAAAANSGGDGGDCIVREGELTMVVFEHAKGSLVFPFDWKWITDRTFARSWGRWAGQLHQLTRRFAVERPDVSGRIRRWDELHHGVLKGVEVAEEDAKLATDPNHFGVLHGDLNISNFFWTPPSSEDGEAYGRLHFFDWDQAQRGWFLYDLASVVYFPYMLSRAGTWMDGSSAPGVDEYHQWTDNVVEGYESVPADGGGAKEKVDRAALERMVLLRRSFSERFCRRGLREMDEDLAAGKADAATQAGMRMFMQWVVDWLDREASKGGP